MNLALIGVGMIGGSAALAWRAAGVVTHVSGFDLDAQALQRARALQVIDAAAPSIAAAVAAADLVLVAVPVGAMAQVFAQLAPHLPRTAVLTDVGSTKASVMAAARRALSAEQWRRFVPAHPIAGRESPGVESSEATLFAQRWVITTPEADTQPEAVEKIERLWSACGAKLERMSAVEHDRIFAAVSHLPHLLAFALVARMAAEPDGLRKLSFAGGGFRDFTRIAASSPVMWRDIALANRAALSEELAGYRAALDQLQSVLDADDAQGLQALFEQASAVRRRMAGAFDES